MHSILKDALERFIRDKPAPEFLPQKRVLVGTHHKTGTVWMGNVFSAICRDLGIRWVVSQKGVPLPREWDVLHDMHSLFVEPGLRDGDFRGMHIVRDPRDLLVSATFYHCKSSESWLHEPRQKFDGLTYQQKINSFDSFDDRIAFELEHSTDVNVGRMDNWDYSDERFLEVRYEDLISDINLKVFRDAFEFLGFRGEALLQCLRIAYNGSLFSGKVAKSAHIRSGKKDQWIEYLSRGHAERMLEKFPGILQKLGYERDNSWVTQLANRD